MAKVIIIPKGIIPSEIDIELFSPMERPTVYAKQYDTNTRYIVANVYNDGEKYPLTTSDTINFACTKPDGFGINNECGIDSDGRIVYQITDQTTAKDGQFHAEFRIYSAYIDSSGNTVQQLKTTANLKMWVDKSALNNNTIISSDEANVLTALISDATKAIADTNSATNNAVNATNTIKQLNANISSAENIRDSNEHTRLSNESSRVTAEVTRDSNENTRMSSETSRDNAESTRRTDEKTRNSNEAIRQSQEATRQTNETTRQGQEATRQDYYKAYKICEKYDNVKLYIVGNKVTYSGGTYQNILPSTGIAPTYNTDNTNWICIAKKGEDGAGGDMFRSTYDSNGKNADIFEYTDNKIGDLNQLPTESKVNLVNSINEINANKLSKDGNSSKNFVTFTEATKDEDILSGDTQDTLFSKIKKRFANILTSLASKFDKANIANNLSTTAEGLALDARQGKVLNESLAELNNKLADKPPASSYKSTLSSQGWYRVAEFSPQIITTAVGASCNSVNISIKRVYGSNNNEYYNLLLMSIYNKSEFIKIGKLINNQCITKIRHTIDKTNSKAYLEIYYYISATNPVTVNLFDIEDGSQTFKWNTITPIATAETVEGVTILSSMDLTTA